MVKELFLLTLSIMVLGLSAQKETNKNTETVLESTQSYISVERIVNKTDFNESFIIESSVKGSQVIAFEMTFRIDGYEKSMLSKSNHLTPKMISHIKKLSKGAKVYVSGIIIKNTDGLTLEGMNYVYIIQ